MDVESILGRAFRECRDESLVEFIGNRAARHPEGTPEEMRRKMIMYDMRNIMGDLSAAIWNIRNGEYRRVDMGFRLTPKDHDGEAV